MNKTEYDERQLLNRYRIGYQALILTMILIVINSLITEFYYVWASPLIEAIIIIYIPAIYFIIMGISKDAYLRRKDHPTLMIVLFGIFMILCIYVIISSISLGTFMLVDNGQLSHSVTPIMMFLYSGSIFFSLLARKLFDR